MKVQTTHLLLLTSAFGFASAVTSCATQTTPVARTDTPSRVQKVRTTAYTHNHGGSGGRNAIGGRLSAGKTKSAAADWSRFPLGTRFRVVRTGQEYIVDDYGGALVGTSTIDLYKTTRGEMHRWGVRHEEIEVLQWGSADESLRVLRKRKGVSKVRRMIASLEQRHQPRQQVGGAPSSIQGP